MKMYMKDTSEIENVPYKKVHENELQNLLEMFIIFSLHFKVP